MGKKYLDTKNNSLESSVLGVWKTAIEEGEAIRDAAQMTKEVTKEEVELKEKPAGFIRLSFNSSADVNKARKWMDQNLLPFSSMTPSLKDIEFEDVDDAEGLMAKLKKAGFKFKVDHREEVELPNMRVELPNMRDALMQVRTEKHDTHVDEGYVNIGGAKVKDDEKSILKHIQKTFPNVKKVKKDSQYGWIPVFEETEVDPEDREELDKEADARGGVETAKKMKRAKESAPNISEASGDKEAYKKFFDAALKKFKVSSPAELKGDQKKKFFDYIDKNWEGDNEKAEGAMSQVREFKIQSMKAALARVWGMKEGKNPFKKEDDDKENKKRVKTETGKKPAEIDLKPKIDDK